MQACVYVNSPYYVRVTVGLKKENSMVKQHIIVDYISKPQLSREHVYSKRKHSN